MKITLDKNKKAPVIKPVNGVQNGPVTYDFLIDTTEYFRAAHFPYSRLHDTEMLYGAGDFVNVHCVFPDPDADPDDPRSYNFRCTDEYIKCIYEAGTKVIYRLGESIENNPRFKKYINPPKDPEKWASVCEHIVAHYNEGWADGYGYGIEYWEIWNEPENPPMWTGTKEQFFDLYRITANRLKSRFPSVKVGGYASCGFYACDERITDPFAKSFITYARDFLTYITTDETRAPLDFFSWHIYTGSADEVAACALYCRGMLDSFGLTGAESILDEWNYNVPDSTGGKFRKSMKAAAFDAEVLVRLQKLPVDVAAYYDAQVKLISYCGLFNEYTAAPEKPYYAFLAFDCVKQYGEPVASCDGDGLYTLASSSRDGFMLMITNSTDEPKTVDIECGAKTARIRTLDRDHDLTETAVIQAPVTLSVGALSVTLIELT